MGTDKSESSDFWDRSERWHAEYIDDVLTDDLVEDVEQRLGHRLPQAYVDLCRKQNGGVPKRAYHPITSSPAWPDGFVQIHAIKGIGFRNEWSLCGHYGQEHSIGEWGYPAIGVYFADLPSGGHDMLCLDYSAPNDQGGPRVVHIDQEDDFRLTFVADSFEAFIAGLGDEDAFETSHDPSPPSMSSRLRDGFVDFGERHPRALYWIGVLTALVVAACVYFFPNRVSP